MREVGGVEWRDKEVEEEEREGVELGVGVMREESRGSS